MTHYKATGRWDVKKRNENSFNNNLLLCLSRRVYFCHPRRTSRSVFRPSDLSGRDVQPQVCRLVLLHVQQVVSGVVLQHEVRLERDDLGRVQVGQRHRHQDPAETPAGRRRRQTQKRRVVDGRGQSNDRRHRVVVDDVKRVK